MLVVEDSLNKIQAVKSIKQLEGLVGEMFADLGYAAFTYLDTRRIPLSDEPAPYFISNVRNGFLEAYASEGFFGYDPCVQRAGTTNSPFTWADCPEYHSWKRRGARSRARQVMQVANDFGFTQGYVLPSHAVDTSGRPASALITLYWKDEPGALIPSVSMPVWLRLATASTHERMLELRGLTADGSERPSLTDRERECLVWACRGKTRCETADILMISDKTVEFHFQNAMRKLRVHNKFHAIAMAIHMGLIVP